MASAHLVSPALASPIDRLAFAPDEVKSYFHTLYEINAHRNEAILRALADVLSALCGVGINPVLLKGVASLVSDLYDDPAERILGDLDLLVRPTQLDKATEVLQSMGYAFESDERRPEERRWVLPSYNSEIPHHIPMLIPSKTGGVGIELHRSLFLSEYNSMLLSADVFEHAVTIDWNGQDVLVPSATDRIVHNIVHELLHHAGAKREVVDLRQFRELACIIARCGQAVDWQSVERSFFMAGQTEVLRERAALCVALMGVHMQVGEADPAGAANRLRMNLLRSPPDAGRWSVWIRLWELSKVYINNFKHDPLLAVNFLNPRWWPNRLRGIWRILNDSEPS